MTSDATTARLDFRGRRLCFVRPVRVIEARSLDEVTAALDAVAEATAAGMHAVGFVAYDASPAFDAALQVRSGSSLPLLRFTVHETADVVDERSHGGGPRDSDATAAGWLTRPLRLDTPADMHAAKVEAIRAAIGRGDVYQVNYTVRARGVATDGMPAALVAGWRRAQGVGYFAELECGGQRIVSLSPELFFEVRGRRITTRPMKGTARRGRSAAEDEAAAAALAASEKDRAENLMIVDLMRNDLGRVAVIGSVEVPRLFDVERYPTVHQLTSTISARLRDDVSLTDIFRALFPCGSVTGAPKVAAMRTIAMLEDSPRGVYCGAIGHVEPGGDCTFSVAIRTLAVDDNGLACYGVGGGITWDSDAGAEYDEASAKADVIRRPWPRFELLETLLLEDGEYPRIAAHLTRLGASARFFDRPAERPAWEIELAAFAAARTGRWRVRLLLDEDGRLRIDGARLPDSEPAALHARIVERAASSDDVFLYHKTTHRRVYEAALESAAGRDDALLTNERGELTELTVGNLVVELSGALYTPPRTSGLLAGVMRGELLAAGVLAERTLRPADLAVATRCWRINAVRGWQALGGIEAADGRLLFDAGVAAAR